MPPFLRATALAAALTVTLAAVPAAAAPLRCAEDGEGGACLWGKVEAFDGGQLQVRGLRLGLVGVVVPSRRDLCANRATREEFDCARPARRRMAELVAKGVACDILDAAGGQLHGRCRVAEGDLGRLLVLAGAARAAKDGPYDDAQAQAVAAHKGLWHADLLLPRDWESARRKAEGRADN